MTAPPPKPTPLPLRRRELLTAATAVAAVSATAGMLTPVNAQGGKIVAEEHWAKKASADLYLYRKRMIGAGQDAAKPVLFLVHGSTFSCRGSYDLQVP
ncbi:MAG: hypothetical protein WAO08_30020, partial [Hyphomicrobiaceae bacterium]